MKVEITHKQELERPVLKIDMDLEKGENRIYLTSRCRRCAGWGCRSHGGTGGDPNCNGGTICIKLEPQDLIKTLGLAFKTLIDTLYQQIVSENK